MSVVIFAGPSISAGDVQGILGAECLPPAAQGDVYRAALSRPLAIGLIDGYFERVPAVWHKEILWALSQGIHVFGSASMGALRAAELAPFGMIGVGAIFEAYRDGILEDDDEVAVAHGPADTGYRAGSDAMVNIRATLARAVSTGVIDDPTASTLERLGKGLFYAERSYARILELAREEGAAAAILDDLRPLAQIGRGQSETRRRGGDAPGDARVSRLGAPTHTGRLRVRGDALVATAEGECCGDWPGARRQAGPRDPGARPRGLGPCGGWCPWLAARPAGRRTSTDGPAKR